MRTCDIIAARSRCRSLAGLFVLVALLGCSVRVHAPAASADVSAALHPGAAVALLGLTTSPTVGHFSIEDATAADDAVFSGLLTGYPGLVLWSAPTVTDLVGDAQATSLRAEYGRLGGLAAARVAGLASSLQGATLLAIARLESDEVHTSTVIQDQANPEARVAGQGEHESPWAMTMATERKAKVSLELFDLQSGASLWRGHADARDRIRYAYDQPNIDPKTIVAEANRPRAADEDSLIVRTGDVLMRPDIVGMIRKACRDLAARLPGAPKVAS